MERTANIDLAAWRADNASLVGNRQLSLRVFAGTLILCASFSALFASWLPLQFSIVTVFLFAGPHNWFELRYFLTRLPVRFGKSQNFFLTAFFGIAFLTLSYIALPVLYSFNVFPDHMWPTLLASWNSLLLLWIGVLVWLRGKTKVRRDWSWALPVAFGLCALNWLAPEFFSLGIVYLHPLVALWFFDRHLARTRPQWLPTYRRCLCLLPLLLVGIFWQLSRAAALPDDNGLFWRITQHAGAQLLPNISSHALVTTHVFLEMLHYGVWLIALPLIAPLAKPRESQTGSRPRREPIWRVRTVPVARHPLGFPKLVAGALGLGVFFVLVLWFGFSVDYATTRDVYFTVAIAHVLAEAPFLLRTL
ncbi:MAG TPA: hypothetical protein VKC61_15820 [Pyrinomonadaceae bacterium]|nr:hypothetical protein [Pyrinomonadaceae bacterium]